MGEKRFSNSSFRLSVECLLLVMSEANIFQLQVSHGLFFITLTYICVFVLFHEPPINSKKLLCGLEITRIVNFKRAVHFFRYLVLPTVKLQMYVSRTTSYPGSFSRYEAASRSAHCKMRAYLFGTDFINQAA